MELRGFFQVSSPAASRSAFMAAKSRLSMKTSPRTTTSTGRVSRGGSERMVRRLTVMSSPMRPSPRVAPSTKAPCW